MATNILMPALSPTMEKGKLAKWLKKEGDAVKSGDVIAEIETDKATMEVEAVDEGVLARILIAEGSEDVAVNTPIAVLADEGENPAEVKAPAAVAAPAASATAPAPAAAPAAVAPAPQSVAVEKGGRVFASPLAKRLAKEKGVDLASLKGSGPHGRIVARDLEGAKPSQAAPKAQAASIADDSEYRLVPHDGMRKVIAQRLTQSKQTVPHFYLATDVTLDRLMAARERINASAPLGEDKKPVWKLSVNDFIIKAMALALQKVPHANANWTDEGMKLFKHSDVGVAVAVEGGLFTPVIRKAELKSLSAISIEMKDLAGRARKRKLAPEEYQGGATAISNLGMFGIKDFQAVINPPHGTILAVGAGEKRCVVENDQMVMRTQMTITLSCDHRAVDGALGAELLGVLKQLLEEPTLMLV